MLKQTALSRTITLLRPMPRLKLISNGTLLLVMLLLLATHNDRARADEGTGRRLVVFSAMGDVPYSPEEMLQLPLQINAIGPDSEFVVHVGDIKTGSTFCVEPVYAKVAGMLRISRLPTFIIPGDNEWNDCKDPHSAWQLWQRYFLRFDQQWQHHLPVFRQLKREENFSFLHRGVLFIGLNIVGGRIHDPQEWPRRHAEDLEWTRTILMMDGYSSVY